MAGRMMSSTGQAPAKHLAGEKKNNGKTITQTSISRTGETNRLKRAGWVRERGKMAAIRAQGEGGADRFEGIRHSNHEEKGSR